MAPRVIEKLRAIVKGKGDKNAARIHRRRKIAATAWRVLPSLKIILLVAGYGWMLIIPSTQFGQGTYIDENALQPGQVNTFWNWGDVHRADHYLAQLEALRDRNASSSETASFLSEEFRKLGIPSATQQYSFVTASGSVNGTNAYAIVTSPRASGSEAMIISASRISRTGEGDGTPNLRGIATVLSLAAFLKRHSLWAKDLIFVVSDGYLEGMQAWISTYHGASQSNMIADPLALTSGVIWTALNIDYPGHSFSHLGVFFEGLNGRLPNQDLINSFRLISQYTGGVPVTVYDHLEPNEFPNRKSEYVPSWVPSGLTENKEVVEYSYRAKNILRHVNYQARGQASGVHGLLHQFRIDAITLFGIPATGPHGFHAIGRIVESTLRTTNNLLERLHASFFFYLLVGTTTFMKIGSYLPSAVLVSTAMLFGGLGEWVRARWVLLEEDTPATASKEKTLSKAPASKWVERSRPVLPALLIMLATHLCGLLLFFILTQPWVVANQKLVYPILFTGISLIPLALLTTQPTPPSTTAPLHTLLKSLNLCLASTVTSVISVLNFSLAATLAISLGLPLSYSSPSPSVPSRLTKYFIYMFLAFGWALLEEEVRQAVWNWEVLGVWFAPFVCIVYTPLVMQAGIVCLLPP